MDYESKDAMKPNRWRKRPVEITAQRMAEPFEVKTMEGTMRGKAGDWLITGVQGEQYPCDDAIFRQTYESPNTESKSVDARTIERAISALRRAYPYMPGDAGREMVSEAADALVRDSEYQSKGPGDTADEIAAYMERLAIEEQCPGASASELAFSDRLKAAASVLRGDTEHQPEDQDCGWCSGAGTDGTAICGYCDGTGIGGGSRARATDLHSVDDRIAEIEAESDARHEAAMRELEDIRRNRLALRDTECRSVALDVDVVRGMVQGAISKSIRPGTGRNALNECRIALHDLARYIDRHTEQESDG